MKILVLLSRIPYPLEKGDKLRAYHQVKELSRRHEICLCCLSDEAPHPDAIAKLTEITSELHIIPLNRLLIYANLFGAWFGNKPFQVAYFYQRGAHRKIRQILHRFNPDHIYCQLVRTTEYVKNEHSIPKTLDYQDAFSKGMARRSKKEKSFLKRKFFRAESRRLLVYEHLIFDFFEHKCIISEQDKQLIFHERQKEIEVIKNGVDIEFFHPINSPKEYDLCFVGNMSYAPNIDSVLYLAKKILPLILDKKPDVKLLISGATPADAVLNLQSESISVVGWVDDIRDSYAKSRLFIAAMQMGTGLQNKLLEAMAMKIPCITSSLANNALGATHEREIMVAKTPSEYADSVLDLLENPTKAAYIAENGHQFVADRFSWDQTTRQLEVLMNLKT